MGTFSETASFAACHAHQDAREVGYACIGCRESGRAPNTAGIGLESSVLRTEATDETQGFVKVLVAADDDRILGFTMIGPARSWLRCWRACHIHGFARPLSLT